MLTLYEVGFNNFLFFKKESIDFRDYGSYLIIGENKDVSSMDSNGSGKTLVYDGITACIFNRTIRGSRINDFVGKWRDTVSVYILFDDKVSGQVYRIKRWGGKKRKVEFKNISTGEDLTKGTPTDTDLAIVRWLGHDFDVFRNTVYSGHDDLDKFLDVTDNKRKDLLSKIRSFANFKGCVKDAKLRKKKYQDIVLNLEYNISELNTRIYDARESIRDLRKSGSGFEDNKKERLEGIKRRRLNLKLEVGRRDKYEVLLIEKNEELENIREDIRRCKEKLGGLILPVIHRKMIDLEKSKTKLGKKNIKIGRDIHEVKKHLDPFSVDTFCSSCGTFITEDIFNKNERYNKKTLISLRKKLVENNVEREGEEKKYDKKIKKLEKLIVVSENLLQHKDVKYHTENDIKSIEYDLKRIKEANEEKKKLKEEERAIIQLKNPIKSGIKKLRVKISEYEETIIKCKKKFKKATREIEVSDFWVHGFGKNGIQNMTLDDVIEALEDGFSIYLDELTSGAISVEFDVVSKGKSGKDLDRFGVLITDNIKDSTHDFRTWSGGEKSVIRFAGDFAFYDLVKANIDLFMLDERLDGMDVSLRAKALSMLGNMKEDRKIICTTHHGEAVSFFDHIIKVTRKDGRSKIRRLQ